jgi:hypothetical protein
MKFFTRRWFQRIQDASGKLPNPTDTKEGNLSESPWQLGSRANAEYHAHLSLIAPNLSGDVARLECFNLHDARIMGAKMSVGTLVLLLHDRFSKRRYNREIRLTFGDVAGSTGLLEAEGQDIIYDEVDVGIDGSFEYRALLDKDEISIRFRSVHIETVSI